MGGLILLGCFDDALELVRPLGPSERCGVLAVFLKVSNQKILQVFLGALHAVRQSLPSENAKKAFDQIHPGSVCWGVVEMDSRMAQEPLFGRFVLVDVEIIEHDVKLVNRIGLYDFVHEAQEIHRRAAITDMSDHLSGGDLERGQQRLRAMTLVFVGPGTGFLGSQR